MKQPRRGAEKVSGRNSMPQNFYDRLCEINSGEGQVITQEPMKKHTTFRVGGNADYYVNPKDNEQLLETVELCRQEGMPCYILGNGSNILVSDAGYRGVILELHRNLNHVQVRENRIYAQAGALLSRAAYLAAQAGLTGMEFASGIPGTVGGALVMNAGAYGGEMKDVVKEALVLTGEGELLTLTGEELELGYRTSIISRKGYIVLEAELELKPGDRAAIEARMEELKAARTTKQPLEYPSAGSTFKRPEGHFAGKLIMDAGLRGCKRGGAQVSEKHCGFVINTGDATAQDVLDLVSHVQNEVERQFGVKLEMEVKTLGF